MPSQEEIVASLREDGYDVEWEELKFIGHTWWDCDYCGQGRNGKAAILVTEKGSQKKKVLCLDRGACRRWKNNISQQPILQARVVL